MSFLFCAKAFRTNGIFIPELSGRSRLGYLSRSLRRTFQIKLAASILIISCVFATACDDRSSLELQATSSTNVFAENAININTATLDELQRIPHIGEKLAAKIIEHRETNGRFRRAEHLMLIQGISDKRFRKIRPLVRVE